MFKINYSDINKKREYPKSLEDTKDGKKLKDIFMDNNEKYGEENWKISSQIKKGDGQAIRIMTWNVHYWSDPDEKPSLDKIIYIIKKLEPDIVCLNEVHYGVTKFNDKDISTEVNKIGYIIFGMCNIVPSWFNVPYGNMILISKKFHNKMKNLESLPDNYNKALCQPSQCYMGQIIRHFSWDCDYERTGKFESRCYIHLSLPFFDVFITHLEAASPDIRISQLKEIAKCITRKSIILGDFNIYNNDDYNIKPAYQNIVRSQGYIPPQSMEEMKYIKDTLKWKDGFEILDKIPLNYSNWTGIRVDYIFFTEEWTAEGPGDHILTMDTYFTNASDHLPIICEIECPGFKMIKQEKPQLPRANMDKDDPNYWLPKNNIIKLTVEEFIRYYNEYAMTHNIFPPAKSINDIKFYNGQPYSAHDWFKDTPELTVNVQEDKYSGILKDIHIFRSGTNVTELGLNGLYGAFSHENALSYFGKELAERKKEKHISLWTFKFDIPVISMQELKILYIGADAGRGYYKEEYDNNYDVVIISGFGIIKITNRLFDRESGRIRYIKLLKRDIYSVVGGYGKEKLIKTEYQAPQIGGKISYYYKYCKYKAKCFKEKQRLRLVTRHLKKMM